MEEKIKYVLNGETKYYTKEELKEYYSKLLKNSGIFYAQSIDEDVDDLINQLRKYDGDPYGSIDNPDRRKYHHELETLGCLYVIR